MTQTPPGEVGTDRMSWDEIAKLFNDKVAVLYILTFVSVMGMVISPWLYKEPYPRGLVAATWLAFAAYEATKHFDLMTVVDEYYFVFSIFAGVMFLARPK